MFRAQIKAGLISKGQETLLRSCSLSINKLGVLGSNSITSERRLQRKRGAAMTDQQNINNQIPGTRKLNVTCNHQIDKTAKLQADSRYLSISSNGQGLFKRGDMIVIA